MSVLQHDVLRLATQDRVAGSPSTQSAPGERRVRQRAVRNFRCLVVSASGERRAMLDRAVSSAGWEAVVCDGAEQGWLAIQRERFPLVFLDLDGAPAPEDLQQLGSEIAGRMPALLAICGNEGNPREEIWARQLGVWLYLPGVQRGSDLESLCREARPVAEKLAGDLPAKND